MTDTHAQHWAAACKCHVRAGLSAGPRQGTGVGGKATACPFRGFCLLVVTPLKCASLSSTLTGPCYVHGGPSTTRNVLCVNTSLVGPRCPSPWPPNPACVRGSLVGINMCLACPFSCGTRRRSTDGSPVSPRRGPAAPTAARLVPGGGELVLAGLPLGGGWHVTQCF